MPQGEGHLKGLKDAQAANIRCCHGDSRAEATVSAIGYGKLHPFVSGDAIRAANMVGVPADSREGSGRGGPL